MERLTDEQISELAECLQDACDEWIAKGGIITTLRYGRNNITGEIHPRCMCPMGVLLWFSFKTIVNFPHGIIIGNYLHIPYDAVWSFLAGFEGDSEDYGDPDSDYRMFHLGRLFRQHYNVRPIVPIN